MRVPPDIIPLILRLLPHRVLLGIYRFPKVARAARMMMNAVIPSGFREVGVVKGPLRGTRLMLDLQSEKYLWLGTFEPWVQKAILRHLSRGDWSWDVGAYIGYHTLLMWRVGARVVSLEPDPLNRARLEQHLSLNGATDVRVLSFAAGPWTASGYLDRVREHPGGSRLSADGGVECQMVSLDSLLERLPPPRLVKVDIEGGEEAMMRGARRLLAHVRPVWILEVHGAAGEEAVSYLRKADYRIETIGKGVEIDVDFPVGGPAHVVALP
jgi:FkbM family methyltransferase